MKAVLISIHPKHCLNISDLRKTLEIRKNIPKLKTPFKCYIYCTQGTIDKMWLPCIDKQTGKIGRISKLNIETGKSMGIEVVSGKVIGEFICDGIVSHCEMANADIAEQQGCIKREELLEYAGGKELYGWHISDLVIYDKPKEVSDFRKPCIMPEMPYCPKCPVGYEYISETEAEFYRADGDCRTEWRCLNYVTQPPQSWCYVEEVQNGE